MGDRPLFLVLLAALVAPGFAKDAVPTTNTSYVIVTSDALIPGSELVVVLHLLDLKLEDAEREDEACVLDLRVTSEGLLWHRTDWEIDVGAVPKSFHKTLALLVPPDEIKLGETSTLKIESHSCFKFSRSVEVPVTKKDLLVSIRTDKSKYHPGEYVLLESLVLTHELRPHLKPVNLSVYNSRNEVLVRWLNVTAEEGLIRERYYVPLLAREDELTVTLENYEQQVNYTLEVELPSSPYGKETFEVEVKSPRYVTVSASDDDKSSTMDVSVMASLESGVPVQGNVELELSLAGDSSLKPLPAYRLEAGHKLISLDLEEVKKVLGMKKDESLVGRTVEVHVTVKEERPPVEKESDGEKKSEESKEEEKGEPKVEDRSELESNETREDEKETGRESMEEGKGSEHEGTEEKKERPAHSVTRVVNVTFVDQSHVLFFSEFTPLYFKPGLSYFGHVLLKPVDESLVTESEEKEVTVKVKHYTSHSESPIEEEIKLKFNSNLIGEFSVRVPVDNTKLELEATFNDKEAGKVVTAHLKDLLPFGSKDGHYLQMSLEHKTPIVPVGGFLKVKVESTFPTDELLYEVFCQSLLVLSGKVNLPSPSTINELLLVVPRNVSHLLSSPRLVVLALTPTHELVSDSLRLVVDDEEEEPLELELKSEVVEPGETVELLVKGEPFTRVYLLATWDLLAYEPKEHDSRKLNALENMATYLRCLNSSQFTENVDLCEYCSPFPSLAPDSQRVFNESSGLLLTDGVLYVDSGKPWPTPSVKNGTLDDLEYPKMKSLVELEARFWHLNVTVGPSGEETLKFVVPEEAKLYTLAAFGLRPGKGLVVSRKPVQLLVTSKLLVDLRHPESVVRGEEFHLDVHLFNNQDKEVEVKVELKKGPGFELSCMRDDSRDEGLEEKVKLKPKETKVVPFPVKTSPTNQEPLEIEVEIDSEDVHLNRSTTLNVEYQGYVVQHPNSSVLDNFNGEEVLVLDLTKRVLNPVEKSERALVKLYGHPLGSAIEHACRDLNESSVLEERTKLLFVLGVNVLEHIANNSLFDKSVPVEYDDEKLPVEGTFGVPVDKDECIESVRDALECRLEKGNPDGSVSFYPSGPGYIWLTTLILDANLLLKDVRFFDKEKVLEKLEWLLKQQQNDGSFVEDETVILLRNPLTTKSRVPLTSQVVVSLLEALETLELPKATVERVESSKEKALGFVLEEVASGKLDNDSYSLNLAAYALALAKKEGVFEVLVKRDRLVKHEDELSFWSVESEEEWNEEHDSLTVEATSYGVLTYLALNDLHGAAPFVEFLTNRMEPDGAFVSTLDTNVALRALSKYYRHLDTYYGHEQVNMEANVTLAGKETFTLRILDPLFVGELYFDSSNLTLGGPLKVESSGVGLLLVQSEVEYNEAVPTSRPSGIDLKLEVQTKDPDHLQLKVCAVNLEKERSTFLVGEVPLLSGYEMNVDDVKSRPDLQVLKQEDVVYLLFDKVENSTPKCVELELERLEPVGSLEPRFVRLYLLNDPDVSAYKSYSGKSSDEMREGICPK